LDGDIGEQDARPNDEERECTLVSCQSPLARSSSSVSFAFAMNLQSWADHFGSDVIDLRTVDFDSELMACIPTEFVRRHRVLPVLKSATALWISIAPPPSIEALDSLGQLVQREISVGFSEAAQIDEFIERLYGWGGSE